MSTKYTVTFHPYTEKNFRKQFRKKYTERPWQFTENAIRSMCSNLTELMLEERCHLIREEGVLQLCKLEFAVAGRKVSAKNSGNRCIFVANNERRTVEILLVYHKSNILKHGNETVAWKKIVRTNFSQYADLLT